MNDASRKSVSLPVLIGVAVAFAIGTAIATALLMNIFERKEEAKNQYIQIVEVNEDTTDPEKWGVNWPREYETYKRTAIATRTRFGGHGGSEAMPEEKIERDPWLKRMFLGYAFAIDYRDRRGHAYMLEDQEKTERLSKPQSGSCLHCHASIMPLYRELGGGDAVKGFEASYQFSYEELNKKLHDSGHAFPVSCVDCHVPKTMQLRVTRPGFTRGIRALAESDAPVPHLPSVERWRAGNRADTVRSEPRRLAQRDALVRVRAVSRRVLLRDQHAADLSVGKGADRRGRRGVLELDPPGGRPAVLRLPAQGVGGRGPQGPAPRVRAVEPGDPRAHRVSCADCHMPYVRDGATKVSDHWYAARCSTSAARARPVIGSPRTRSSSAWTRSSSAISISCSAAGRR